MGSIVAEGDAEAPLDKEWKTVTKATKPFTNLLSDTLSRHSKVPKRLCSPIEAYPSSSIPPAGDRGPETVTTVEDRIDDEVNENLSEYLNESQSKPRIEDGEVSRDSNTRHINDIREYFDKACNLPTDQSWLTLPELPTSVEVGRLKNGQPAEGDIPVPVNKVDGPWSSKQEYLQSHYELLREDGVASLREAVEEIRAKPELMEKDSQEHSAIYENVYISGVTFAQRGIAVRVEFSLRRAGKMIRWEQSKRLTSGTLVALTPATDMFATVCKVAVVTARPLVGLQQVPPSIDIYFNSSEEVEIDPQKKWLMVEARSGFFEAQRHTLRALQKMACECFPLVEHIVDLERQISAPDYIQEQPVLDVSAIISEPNKYMDINVLDQWPDISGSNLDDSQLTALRRILTKRVAIVQGPPGTGKTHVSVVALEVLLSNMSGRDPPIIVAAQTNHALDQLLRHIAVFEPKFVRLGGRTADQLIIKPRTLFEIKRMSPPNSKGSGGAAKKSRRTLAQEMTKLLDPLTEGKEPFTAEILQSLGLISETQFKSLVEHAENWAGVSNDGVAGLMASWLESYLIPATRGSYTANNNMEAEEVDLEFEQLKETEAENGSIDDDSFELLRGEWVALAEPYTGRGSSNHTDVKIEQLLKHHQDLYRIHPMYRGSIYSYFQRKVKEEILKVFRMGAKEYDRVAKNLQIAKWEVDLGILRGARVIGMTTTGLSKYRPLVASLKPRVVLIEEAAETLEAPVIAACFESLQHLILVGDHQQLRGHCAVQDLEGPPFNLDVSAFERLVTNKIEFSQLTRQRRMRPEIRKIISPIYENLQDHPCVENREDVPGMGGVNSFFYTHTLTESNDDTMSKRNLEEADMVVSFFDYLVYNGMEVKDITVLTFYNGQRKRILQGLRKHRNLQGGYQFKVATVDSYQGEENEVVILSLVRNNPHEIGFLKIDNRVCVALSRARRGFYLFGNDKLLRRASPLWNKVLRVMEEKPRRIGQALPITCTNHHVKTMITYPSEWESVNGGCKTRCEDLSAAAPQAPDLFEGLFSDQSKSSRLAPEDSITRGESRKQPFSRGWKRAKNHAKAQSIDLSESTQAWGAFAAGGHREADARLREEGLAAAKEEQQRLLDDEMARALFGPPSPPVSKSSSGDDSKGVEERATHTGAETLKQRTSRKTVWTLLQSHEEASPKQTSLLDLD
ncbi:hypothetical protein MMC26_005456 [Xylographa opegraphella]|nr:hypothetical protein [Xylographa opegraphella]